jgi:hypothetical protein
MRDRNSIRHMFGDSSDVDLALDGGQPLRGASVKQFFRCITLLHRGVGDMREGQTQMGAFARPDRSCYRSDRNAACPRERQCRAGRVYDAYRGI